MFKYDTKSDNCKRLYIMAAKILIVEDDLAVREMLAFTLKNSGFNTLEASDSESALDLIKKHKIDLILLDWMLPGMNGIEFSKRLRSNSATKNIPIIMLTAKGEEENKIKGLEAGADDYLQKPFSVRELIARIRALLRRRSPELIYEPIDIMGLVLDPAAHRLKANNKTIKIGPTEFKLLHFLMKNTDLVFSRNQILDRVWGNKSEIDDRTVDVHIKRLRACLLSTGHDKLIQTVRSEGYRLSKN